MDTGTGLASAVGWVTGRSHTRRNTPKPIVGGFVARLSARIRNAYERDPVLQSILDASEGRPVALQRNVCRDSVTCVVRYVVIDRETASPSLVALVEDTFALREIDSDGTRTIFAVEGVENLCLHRGRPPFSQNALSAMNPP